MRAMAPRHRPSRMRTDKLIPLPARRHALRPRGRGWESSYSFAGQDVEKTSPASKSRVESPRRAVGVSGVRSQPVGPSGSRPVGALLRHARKWSPSVHVP
jgi:hypothetical protein